MDWRNFTYGSIEDKGQGCQKIHIKECEPLKGILREVCSIRDVRIFCLYFLITCVFWIFFLNEIDLQCCNSLNKVSLFKSWGTGKKGESGILQSNGLSYRGKLIFFYKINNTVKLC